MATIYDKKPVFTVGKMNCHVKGSACIPAESGRETADRGTRQMHSFGGNTHVQATGGQQ
ncbi:hypothetical protein MKY42_00835 [Paenibacillus sp. FSL W7-1088]|uniref:hypothetical protein n=1 Tax=Paenibacillus sp. FSL W7-1088 TaxID=2921695 RepID=UPI0030EB9E04